MQQSVRLDPGLIAKYDRSGPRYTSYPTAVQFHEGFGEADYLEQLERSNAAAGPLSLYFHIPFCDTICFYCACNKIATKDRTLAEPYLQRLERELALQAARLTPGRVVEQLHWGGGTPTFISQAEMRQLMAATRRYFTLLDDDSGEYSIEIDPREADAASVRLLRELGFNRMSLGVQDFDPRVQQAVNRLQSRAQTEQVLTAARDQGFRSISLDLIYGLPLQRLASFEKTLDVILDLMPERLSVFNYAHLPERFKPQRRIAEAELPSPEEKLDILAMTIDKLANAGYLYIGMDHFARPDDELAVAQREGSLYRNFQGYSTHASCDLLGFGVTSVGKVADCYSQNVKGLDAYYTALDAGHLPVYRGVTLSRDDQLRRDVITRLICHFELEMAAVEQVWEIDFADYFAPALGQLIPMAADGLLTLEPGRIQVLPVGRLLIRNICMAFDAYLGQGGGGSFSKVI